MLIGKKSYQNIQLILNDHQLRKILDGAVAKSTSRRYLDHANQKNIDLLG